MKINQTGIEDFCRRYKVRELSLFGTAAMDRMTPDSDVDILVDFQPDADVSLFDLIDMKDELSEMFGGREVDLITRRGLERSRNPIRKQGILSTLKRVYVA